MKQRTKLILIIYLSLLIVSNAYSQEREVPPVQLKAISSDLFEIVGGRGANGGVYIGDNGVLAIDAKRRRDLRWEVFINGGRIPTGLDAIEWAQWGVDSGAGEILLTRMDRDGTEDGYDLELTEAIASAVSVPVIASGGGGKKQDFVDLFRETQAEAALAATIFHDKLLTIDEIKQYLIDNQIPMRWENNNELN